MSKFVAIALLCFVLYELSDAARIPRQAEDSDIAFPDVDIDDRYGNPDGGPQNQGGRPGRPGGNRPGQGGNFNNGGGGRPGQGGNINNGGGRPGQGGNVNGGGRPGQQGGNGGGRPGQQTTRRPATTTQATNQQQQQTSTANPQCERQCLKTPEYNPVCGSNGQNYSNMSNLECARRCGLPNLQFSRLGNCPPPATS